MLADALTGARPDFIDAALAYVRFALDHPGHYAVMFDKSLYDPDDPELVAAENAAGAELAHGVGTLDDPRAKDDPQGAALAAWSLVHGFSLLWLNKAIDNDADPMATVSVAGCCSTTVMCGHDGHALTDIALTTLDGNPPRWPNLPTAQRWSSTSPRNAV